MRLRNAGKALWLFGALAAAGAGIIGASGSVPSRGARAEGAQAAAGGVLRRVATIALPGPPGKRFDYLTIDEDDRYLLSAHLAAGLLYVIDLGTHRVVATVPGVPGIEGVAYVPEGKKVYTSNWGERRIGVVDLRQRKVVKRIPAEAKPDGIAYAPPFRKLYISDERAKAELVVDVVQDRLLKTLRFESETGVPQYDPVSRMVYLNLQDRDALAVIDPATDTVAARYPVEGCRGNHGMALDPQHRRAFLSCEGNDVLTVFDLEIHRAIAHLPMAKGADVVQFDPGLGRIYVACASGAIAVFQQDGPDRYRKLEDVPVQPKVHSLAVDPRTHRVYAPEEEADGRPVARMAVYEAVVSPSRPR